MTVFKERIYFIKLYETLKTSRKKYASVELFHIENWEKQKSNFVAVKKISIVKFFKTLGLKPGYLCEIIFIKICGNCKFVHNFEHYRITGFLKLARLSLFRWIESL